MKEYIFPLTETLRKLGNKERAEWSASYVKNQFEFLGIETAIRRKTVKEFVKKRDLLNSEEFRKVSLDLWELPYREFQHSAIDILELHKKRLQKEDIYWIEQLLITKSWWDTVDGLATWICGTYFRLFPEQIPIITEHWMASENIWLERTCLLFQLKYKSKTDTVLLSDLIERLSIRKEFFIRKAIGWVLREYSKTNPEWVRGFIEKHELSALSRKEAEKYL